MLDLAPDVIALLCLAALAAGFIDAIAGGGGLITVPALLAAGVDPVSAIATNKVQGSFGTASATWSFWRAGRIDFRLLTWPLAATLAGAALGSLAVTMVDTRWLMVLLPLLLGASPSISCSAPRRATRTPTPGWRPSPIRPWRSASASTTASSVRGPAPSSP